MDVDMLKIVADVYRDRGPLEQQVAARSFLALASPQEVERQLGALLEAGSLVAAGNGTVTLSPAVRLSLLTQPVLTEWVDEANSAPPHVRTVLVAGIRAELRELVRHALSGGSTGHTHRGVHLAAVLAMADLDPRAVDLVAGLPGTTRSQLQQLATLPEGSCKTLKELQTLARRSAAGRSLDAAQA
jgi:hypothetical protein